MTTSFLCTVCRDGMCEDCVNIADEYQELLENRTRALGVVNSENERLKIELQNLQRRCDMYEEVSKAGIGAIISAWIDKEINQLLKVTA